MGRRFTGLCPFHSEKSPSFSINPEMGVYYCFGCQKSGDAITFVREIEHLDFVEAVERLAGRAGITLRYDDASFSVERKRKQRLHDAITEAIDYYHSLLLESADAGTARRYLRSRGYDGDVARRFSLGYAPDGYDALSRHLQNKKFAAAGHRRRRARLREPDAEAAGPVPRPVDVPDLGRARGGGRLRRAHARRSGPEVQELAREPDLSEVAPAVRPALGEG